MGIYRTTRNIEASIIDFLTSKMSGNWDNVEVTRVWDEVRKLTLPVVLIRCGTTLHNPVEVGGNSTWREPIIAIDIFASGDGQRLDLKDFIISEIKGGCPYYIYEIENRAIKSKTLSGRIRVTNIDDDPINFDLDKDIVDKYENYRHLISLTVATGKVES